MTEKVTRFIVDLDVKHQTNEQMIFFFIFRENQALYFNVNCLQAWNQSFIWILKEAAKLIVPRRYFFCGSFMFYSLLCLLCLCARLFICALWSSAGKGLTSWLTFVVSNCEFVTFPLVSWVRFGTWLYPFLIFAPLLTFIDAVCCKLLEVI